MKKILYFIFCIFLFSSCDSDKVIEESEDIYAFKSIKYFLKEGDGMNIGTALIDSRKYSNRTTTDELLTIGVPDQVETSQFIYNEKSPFTLQTNDLLKISVPVLIDGDEILVSTNKWKYSVNGIEDLPFSVLINQVENIL